MEIIEVKVDRYKCSDNEIFKSEKDALHHEITIKMQTSIKEVIDDFFDVDFNLEELKGCMFDLRDHDWDRIVEEVSRLRRNK